MINRRLFLACSGAAVGALALRPSAAQPGELHVCPKSKPPERTLSAFDLRELTSQAWDMQLTLTCLQGIVNRSRPRLYLIQDHYDELWLEWMRERGDIEKAERLDVGQVFERFLPSVNGVVITDPAVPGSVNAAAMVAAARDWLVATPATAAQYDLPQGSLPDSWKTGLDMRMMNWRKNIDAYRWAYRELDESLSRRAIAFLDPATIGLRDYLVEFRIPTLWISGPHDAGRSPAASFDEEKQFARETLMKWPANIPCLGWPGNGVGTEEGIGEWDGVRLGSECGKFEVCSAYDGYSPTVSNLSVHSGTTAQLHQSTPSIPLQRDKVYVAFTRSDGDGWNFLRHYYRKLFDDPQHGSVPIGWQVGPTATDTMPDILDYYYKHARGSDYFINALSGVGYIHEDVYAANYPAEQRREILKEFQRLSGIYRQRLDTHLLSTFSEMQPGMLELLAGIPGIEGVFANYGRTHATTPENTITSVGGKPVFRSINRGAGNLTFTPYGRQQAEWFMIGEIKRWTPAGRPAFLHVFLANWLTHMQMAQNIVKGLGPGYATVRPDQLLELYQAAKRS